MAQCRESVITKVGKYSLPSQSHLFSCTNRSFCRVVSLFQGFRSDVPFGALNISTSLSLLTKRLFDNYSENCFFRKCRLCTKGSFQVDELQRRDYNMLNRAVKLVKTSPPPAFCQGRALLWGPSTKCLSLGHLFFGCQIQLPKLILETKLKSELPRLQCQCQQGGFH